MAEQKSKGQSARAVPRGTALDPKNPSLVQPFKRLVDEGFITELVATFTPMGVTFKGKPDKRLASIQGLDLQEGQDTALGILAAAADQGNLIPIKGKKKSTGTGAAQPLPEKSLCKEDFKGTGPELLARAQVVAGKCGGGTLVGRVRSAGNFEGTLTTSFQNWWMNAPVDKRASALISTKRLAECSKEDIAKLRGMPCPFRGTAEFTVSDEDEDDQPPQAGGSPKSQK